VPRTPTPRSPELVELQEGLSEVYRTEAWQLVLDEVKRVVAPVRRDILNGTRSDVSFLHGVKAAVKAIYTAAGDEIPESVNRMFQ